MLISFSSNMFQRDLSGGTGRGVGGGGDKPGNSWWACAAQFFKSRPYFRPKTFIFHIHFQTWHLRNYVIIS